MSMFIKDYIDREVMTRRKLLLAGAAGMATLAVPAVFGRGQARAALTDPAIAWSYRDRASAYWNAVVSGGEAFVESIDRSKSDMVNLISEGSSEKSLADIKAFLAKAGGNCTIASDPNDSPNARPIVEAVQAAGGYISTIWNKTDDLHPWDFGDNYVSHMIWSDEQPSEQTARMLFEAMGGQGRRRASGRHRGEQSGGRAAGRVAERAEGLSRYRTAGRAARRLGYDQGGGADVLFPDPVWRPDHRRPLRCRQHRLWRDRGVAGRRSCRACSRASRTKSALADRDLFTTVPELTGKL